MVKPNVALLFSLGALLVLAAPAAADSNNGPGPGQGNGHGQGDSSEDNADDGSGASEPPADDGTPSDNGTAAGSGNSTTSSSSGANNGPGRQGEVVCRVLGTHINDPRVPKSEWVDVDPDGCLQRVVYRALGIPPSNPAVYQVRQRLPL